MCVVELDGRLLGQLFPICVVAQKTSHQVSQRTSDKKIFLHEAQLLSGGSGVIWIQDTSQGFGFESPAESAYEISCAEFLKIEVIWHSRSPESEGVDCFSSIAHYRTIKRYAEQARRLVRNHNDVPIPHFEAAIQLDLHLLVGVSNLPWISVAQPVVWLLPLPTIHKRLSKHAVFVAQTITCGGKLHGGHRVEEARRQAAQASVPQTSIRFLLNQFKPVDSFFFDGVLRHRIKQQVRNVVGQRTPKEKFHGKVIDALSVLLLIGRLGLHPALRQDVAFRMRERLEAFACARNLRVDRPVKNQVPFVERIFRSGKPNCARAVWLEKLRNVGWFRCHWNNLRGIGACHSFCTHSGILLVRAIYNRLFAHSGKQYVRRTIVLIHVPTW